MVKERKKNVYVNAPVKKKKKKKRVVQQEAKDDYADTPRFVLRVLVLYVCVCRRRERERERWRERNVKSHIDRYMCVYVM